MDLSHKIEIFPNNQQKTHLRKAFGCTRLAWNWGLEEWMRQYKAGEKPTGNKLALKFNRIKKDQFPFVLEVSSYAVKRPFKDLDNSFSSFFKGVSSHPKFKKKKENIGSYYLGGNVIRFSDRNENSESFKSVIHNKSLKHQYLWISRLGWVKMAQRLRFSGKVKYVVISTKQGRFFASFCCEVSIEEYASLHKPYDETRFESIGIDLGIKHTLVTSCGVAIEGPHPDVTRGNRLARKQRKLSKRNHVRSKHERIQQSNSNNYRKLGRSVAKEYGKRANIRHDFVNKLTTVLVRHFKHIGIERLDINKMMKNKRIANFVFDSSFYEIRRQIEYKSKLYKTKVVKAETYFPSSKTCSCCGNVKRTLTWNDRIYRCDCCGIVIDRDLNASLNLRNLCRIGKIGRGSSEFTPEDLAALQSFFDRNEIATSKVETGNQHGLF